MKVTSYSYFLLAASQQKTDILFNSTPNYVSKSVLASLVVNQA